MVSQADGRRSRLRFTVSDTGIGIPAEQQRLFEAFEQADASLARRYGGTGLGTTIAKGLTEAMGGSIGFESTEQRGSRFWVELPFDVPARRAGARSGAGGTGPVAGRQRARRERHRVRRSVPAPSRARAQPAHPDRRRPRRQPHGAAAPAGEGRAIA